MSAVPLPFFTSVLDLANNLEPLSLDDSDESEAPELAVRIRKTAPPKATSVDDLLSELDLNNDSDNLPEKPIREAQDVWPFVRKNGIKRLCTFCECVYVFIQSQYILNSE